MSVSRCAISWTNVFIFVAMKRWYTSVRCGIRFYRILAMTFRKYLLPKLSFAVCFIYFTWLAVSMIGVATVFLSVAFVHIGVWCLQIGMTSRYLPFTQRVVLFIMSRHLLEGSLSRVIVCYSLGLFFSYWTIPNIVDDHAGPQPIWLIARLELLSVLS